MLIGLVGKKRVGKDTFGDFLVNNYNFEKKSFSENLKIICRLLYGLKKEDIEEKKDEYCEKIRKKPREILQEIGTEIFRNYDKEIWINSLFNNINFEKNIVICDCRFQNEINKIKEKGGFIIQIINERVNDNDTPIVVSGDTHISENNNLNGIDYVIINSYNLENYYNDINNIIKKLNNKKIYY